MSKRDFSQINTAPIVYNAISTATTEKPKKLRQISVTMNYEMIDYTTTICHAYGMARAAFITGLIRQHMEDPAHMELYKKQKELQGRA